MKSIKNLGLNPLGSPLLADDIIEFHAARLLLLFQICGIKGKIDGLTKMAKLDFFIRYPSFFNELCLKLNINIYKKPDAVESKMIRFHYGPWDHRYYHVLAYLKSRGLIEYEKIGRKVIISLTKLGQSKAILLKESNQYSALVTQISLVNSILGKMSGTKIKNLIYETFDQEVVQLSLGEVIK